MNLQQPLDYAENYDQLEEFKSVTPHSKEPEANTFPAIDDVDDDEKIYMSFV